MIKRKPVISIVTPVYNEEENVAVFYAAVKKELDQIADEYDYEFVFTDNRSQDRTFDLLRDIARNDPRVKVARFSRNFGYQKSIFTGYCLAAGDVAIEMDCDLQDPPEMLHAFLAKWKEGYEVVYGVRNTRKEGWFQTRMRQCFYRMIRFLSEDDLPLDAGDFRLVDRKVLDQVKRLYDATPYLRGTIATMGFKQIGLPYDRHQRLRGQSKFNFSSMFALAMDGILNHSIVPLRCATFTGFFISIGLLLYFIALYNLTFFFHYPWPKGFATMSVLILISITLNALFLGIIGEYLGRIYRQIKGQPITIVDETLNLSDPGTVNREFPGARKS
ncbi:MAG: glycosyltransferase family 2 protein [Candidatus Omnitrophica bacterium]|nr:glycosyltransferase family 2 protein [Candidatus Omnitrophota bacterium]MDD5671058.1 glycosyltransferase family 2 protein [Candidatus Omnitrophota bacterium]